MSEKMTNLSCTDFALRLASSAPVPGGGGAAALAGALGVALCSMAGNLTLGRKKYAAVEEDIRRILASAEALQARLLALVDEDAELFEPLSRAYSIPKDAPDRDEILKKATLNACTAPLEMMRCTAEAIDLLEEMLEKGSVMLVSDVGCGAILCRAALQAASLNIFINTKTLSDRAAAARLDEEADKLLSSYLPKAAAIAEEVTRSLRPGK